MTLQQKNKELGEKLARIKIKNINITVVGNSISSGYSMIHAIKPLLAYNETLKEDIKGVSTYHFARAQDNCDAHIYRWLRDNYTLEDIYQMNRRDYVEKPELMPLALDQQGRRVGIPEEKINEHYPKHPHKNPHFQELVTPQENTSNIIIYNGATGSFLDNWTRQGPHKLTGGINRDICALDAFMQEITFLNERYSNFEPTQVYLCGVPKIIFSAEEIINKKLRNIAKRHPEVTYVESVKTHLWGKCDNGKIGIDPFHYSEEEYQELNLNIMQEISQNYLVNRSVIKTAQQMKQANNHLFYSIKEDLNTPESKKLCTTYFDYIIEEQLKNLNEVGEDQNQYLRRLEQEVKENKAHEYFTLVKTIEPEKRIQGMKK